ncbi:hypothetical protein B7494_g4328 [Chlorociboria aeruginascens]|nr:hypothetical protein B7494_g4328 [Chlorociboria aeruginascens]
MSTTHLSNDNFFMRLSELFDKRRQKDHGSIFLTQKRMTHGGDAEDNTTDPAPSQPFSDLNLSRPLPIIIRATNSKSKRDKSSKIKLSTIVEPDDIERFFGRYADVCKLGMSGLKKRDRSKQKEKLKAKKKKKGTVSGEEANNL